MTDEAQSLATRRLGLRILAALLAGLWCGLAVAVLVAYRPGGPIDLLVGAAAFLPVLVALAAIAWPPVALDWRAQAAIAWVGIGSALLVAPLLIGVLETLAAGGRQTLLPSAEVAYSAILALGTTCAFGAIGIIRQRTGAEVTHVRVLAQALGLAGMLTLTGAVLFGGVAVANDVALRDRAPTASRYGPTDPSVTPPHCADGATLGPSAVLHVDAQATVDDVIVGTSVLDGVRQGVDEQWTASMAGDFASGSAAYIRVGAAAWLGQDGAAYSAFPIGGFTMPGADGLTVDGPVLTTALGPSGAPPAEEVGVELVGGAPSRHCRTAIDGPTAVATMLPVRWLAGGDLVIVERPLAAWRGTLDWWVFSDGQLGQATLTISGYPGDAWPSAGLQGSITAHMTALDRTVPRHVTAPAGATPASDAPAPVSGAPAPASAAPAAASP